MKTEGSSNDEFDCMKSQEKQKLPHKYRLAHDKIAKASEMLWETRLRTPNLNIASSANDLRGIMHTDCDMKSKHETTDKIEIPFDHRK